MSTKHKKPNKPMKPLPRAKKYTMDEINDAVLSYQQNGNSKSLKVITEACTPMILSIAKRQAIKFNKDIYEVISDLIQVLYLYIPKYKPNKYHFMASFKVFINHNKNLRLCYSPERVPIKLSKKEKDRNIRDLNMDGITKSRNGSTYYAKMCTTSDADLLLSKMGSHSDDISNIVSIAKNLINDDCRAYMELVMAGMSMYEIRIMANKGTLVFVNNNDNLSNSDYLAMLNNDLRDAYNRAVEIYNCQYS